ncbi:hypothetical protein EDD15DRAFT_410615 [Pisolithus albus]|nr:hypothetical protein EDD15DRAFT_410615 [Pisolithus albus]
MARPAISADAQYTISVSIGNPVIYYNFVVDTGSSNTFLRMKQRPCGRTSSLLPSTPPYGLGYFSGAEYTQDHGPRQAAPPSVPDISYDRLDNTQTYRTHSICCIECRDAGRIVQASVPAESKMNAKDRASGYVTLLVAPSLPPTPGEPTVQVSLKN